MHKKYLCLFFVFIFAALNSQNTDLPWSEVAETPAPPAPSQDNGNAPAQGKTPENNTEPSQGGNQGQTGETTEAQNTEPQPDNANKQPESGQAKPEETKVSALVFAQAMAQAVTNDKTLYSRNSNSKVNRPEEDKLRSAKVVHKFSGGVTEIMNSGTLPIFFAAGKDGFVTRYSYPKFEPDTWQLSSMPIQKIAVHPQGKLIAVYETNGFSVHQVSLWDWAKKKTLFSKRLSDSVVSLSWSANGTYLFVGNRSTDGITVLDSKGIVQKIYQEAPGIVFLAATASTERSIVTYGESGRLVYTDIAKKKKLKEFRTENKLENTNLIKNFTRIIGYKDNNVYVVDAVTGKTVSKHSSRYALFASKIQDSIPIWIERTKRKNEWCIRQGDAASKGFYVPGNSKITAARHIKDHMIIGTQDGSIYKIDLNEDSSVNLEKPLTYSAAKIDDITSDGSILYILKNGNIYAQKGPEDKLVSIAEGLKTNKFTFYNNGFLLWSDLKKGTPISHYSLDTKTLKKIITPKETVISVSVYKNLFLYVESFNGVTLVNFENGKKEFVYNAPGIQNAVQIDDSTMIVAKSAIGNSQSPVFIINTVTEETSPISMEGNLAFALEQNSSRPNNLACFLIETNTSPKTELLHIGLNRKNLIDSTFKPILSYKEEDVDAFLEITGNDILTNLGNSSLVHYSTSSKQARRLSRSYGFPKEAIILKKYFISLNFGDTVSWYERKTGAILKTINIE
ncbi:MULTISPECIES: WD40 repeat domain-containing protein [unclassified Treponema]|uniref:WD40 repeat domain-containing protein n=1 Tax=unclassified Treponema TaxID=2638727 RepID=UPI0020A4C27C|nr:MULTISPECIES: WD40 repeat domain-containing protein [unclassified Treponema]UTC67557.1 WD40 repeat domain-containing protein [Treponema sp. OMZ 789]UTC70285.1 WD40 repeat domain-containing protein [Treponema sp. OMZ 790]UTC73000.1 WD40 repeat domain-containing protein [Treponema sp. OMZ 791]